MDGLTLSLVVRELKEKLLSGRVDKVTQPEKDVVILQFRAHSGTERLLMCASPDICRVHLTRESFVNPPDAPMFCMLLRKHLQGSRLVEIRQPGCDRVAVFVFEGRDELGDPGQKELVLEMMGRHSNLTLVSQGKIIDAARHISYDMSRVRQILPGLAFVPPPVQDRLDPLSFTPEELAARLASQTGPLDRAIARALSGIGPATARELALRVTGRTESAVEEEDAAEAAGKIRAFLKRTLPGAVPCLLRDEEGLPKEILPFFFLSLPEERQFRFPDCAAVMDACYSGRDLRLRMEQKNASLRHTLRTVLERDEKKLLLQEEELSQSARMEEWRVAGELLTAQAALIPKGAREAELVNYYDEEARPLRVTLDPALSPVQNAQKYFKKYRKARSAQRLAAEQKEKTLAEIRVLEEALEDLEKCENEDEIAEVRAYLTENGLLKPQAARKGSRRARVSRPHRFVTEDGLEVLVGKNSMQNERLTHDAAGSDLWLHARDMPGSHVILRKGEGPASRDALETALKLAAYYSRGRGVRVPVDMTERRYVKKPGGTPAGFVTYTHETTVMVSCTEGEVSRLKERADPGRD